MCSSNTNLIWVFDPFIAVLGITRRILIEGMFEENYQNQSSYILINSLNFGSPTAFFFFILVFIFFSFTSFFSSFSSISSIFSFTLLGLYKFFFFKFSPEVDFFNSSSFFLEVFIDFFSSVTFDFLLVVYGWVLIYFLPSVFWFSSRGRGGYAWELPHPISQ